MCLVCTAAAAQAYISALMAVPLVRELRPEFHIFCKHGDNQTLGALRALSVGGDDAHAAVAAATAVVVVTPLANAGKEGETYLQYIARHYYDLPEYVLCTQVCVCVSMRVCMCVCVCM